MLTTTASASSERVALQTDFGGNDRGYRWFMAFDWSVGLFRIFRRLLTHLFGDQVPNQIFPIKTLASVAPRHGDWTMQKLLPREVLFQAVNSVDQWLKSMLTSKS
jgi:hypothetical protein